MVRAFQLLSSELSTLIEARVNEILSRSKVQVMGSDSDKIRTLRDFEDAKKREDEILNFS